MFTKKRIFKTISLYLYICLLILSCKEEAKTKDVTDTKETITTKESKEETSKTINDTNLYPWVDNLNIRNNASTKAKTIATASKNEPLQPTGKVSDQKETIVLRGVAYYEPWFEITTKDNKTGWVFGGTVKKKDEEKGNEIISDINFNFPYFGTYDLSTWKKMAPKDESGGDAEIETTVYQKGNLAMEVSIMEVGEYGYGRTYVLKENDAILKERNFQFTADMEFRELTEVVKDYTQNPPKQYSRSQPLDTHFIQLNAKPIMVNGDWKTTNLDIKNTNNNE